MKFLVDAQLPRRRAFRLRELGHSAMHSSDLPRGNATEDRDIAWNADAAGSVVITKEEWRN